MNVKFDHVSNRSFTERLPARRLDELDVTHAQSRCQFIEANDGRISKPAFQIADVLLAVARQFCKALLREHFLEPDAPNISPDQFAHVHARRSAGYIL
jgi:hypothetical protein